MYKDSANLKPTTRQVSILTVQAKAQIKLVTPVLFHKSLPSKILTGTTAGTSKSVNAQKSPLNRPRMRSSVAGRNGLFMHISFMYLSILLLQERIKCYFNVVMNLYILGG